MKLEDALKQTHGMRVTVGGTTFGLSGTTVSCNGYTESIEDVTTMTLAEMQTRFDVDDIEIITVLRWVCTCYMHDVLGDL